MQLTVGDRVYRIRQMCPDFVILHEPIDHPPVEAEVAIWIDGHEDRWRVWLPEGINSAHRDVKLARCDRKMSAAG
jgi:hypothetical protein